MTKTETATTPAWHPVVQALRDIAAYDMGHHDFKTAYKLRRDMAGKALPQAEKMLTEWEESRAAWCRCATQNEMAQAKVEELRQAIADMHAFVQWALENGAQRLIIPTINHDLAGLLSDDPAFSPRSHGYAARPETQPATA